MGGTSSSGDRRPSGGEVPAGPSTERPSLERAGSSSSTICTDVPSFTARARFSMHRGSSHTNLEPRRLCKHGTECYRASPQHLKEEAHPADDDYLMCCRHFGVKPQFVSIWVLFRWCDAEGAGRASREALEGVWEQIQGYGVNIGPLDDEMWKTMDDDGNGHVNFSEFAEFTTKFKLSLPLGLDELLRNRAGSNAGDRLRCGVHQCDCRQFQVRRPHCKYGRDCYQKKEDHRGKFCHPGDADWELKVVSTRDSNMCICGHKLKLHASPVSTACAVKYPASWTSVAEGDEDFNQSVPLSTGMVAQLQELTNKTYDDITTRDRFRHSGSWMVPRGFDIKRVARNENSKLWRKYTIKKAELTREQEISETEEDGLGNYKVLDDVKSTGGPSGTEALDRKINEWYLWHGTSGSAAANICQSDFKMRLAGTTTGTLYGRGSYLAESFTKADEYSKIEDGTYTMLLCRVLGGRVRLCEDREPDAAQLTRDCIEGNYDCVVGDRRVVSKTYREFVIFDAENVYPEYILSYTRGELFKSKSFPGGPG